LDFVDFTDAILVFTGFTVKVIVFFAFGYFPFAADVIVILVCPYPLTVTFPFLSTVATFLSATLYVSFPPLLLFAPRENALQP